MRIALTGMKGVGKSTLGARLAEELSLPFYDTDREIEVKHRKTCREIYFEEGEKRFRELESQVVRVVARIERGVVALGGGTLLDPENFKLIVPAFKLILLEEKSEVLEARMKGSSLLIGTSFQAFYMKRRAHYDALPAVHVEACFEKLLEACSGK